MNRTRRARWHAPLALITSIALLAGSLPARRARADEPVAPTADEARPVHPSTVVPHEASATATQTESSDVSNESEAAPARPVAASARTATGAEAEEAAPVARSESASAAVTAGAAGAGKKPLVAQAPSNVESVPVDGTDKTGASSQAISLPQGAGKIQGMGESFSTDLSTGVANFTVPFALVAARGGAQPSLALHYSSASGHGVGGVGWDAGVPFIARQTDRGLPLYQDPASGSGWSPTQDRFVFNGGQELVPICLVSGGSCSGALPGEVMPSWAGGWQYFRSRVEGSYLRFFWSANHRTWRVQAKSGETMELGTPLDTSGDTSGLEVDPNHTDHIFRWDLVRQYDAYGNANPADNVTLPTPVNPVVYRYLSDGGMAYLSDIYDTSPAANPTTAPLSAYAHHAHLTYATRPDVTFSFRRGWQVTQDLRLTGVDVTSEDFGASGVRQLVRRYHLTYDANYHVSLLTSVQTEGRCSQPVAEDSTGALPATTSCPMLPAMTFGYQHVAGYDTSGGPAQSDLPGYEPFDARITQVASSPANSLDETLTDLFDINADGLPDVLVTSPGLFSGNHGVYFNSQGGQANSFGHASLMPVSGVLGETASTITLDNLNVSALDLDGDGVVDLLHMPQVKTYSVYSPQGSGTSYSWIGRAVTTASQQNPKLDLGSDTPNVNMMDVNGDGLVDQVLTTGTDIETFFSLGRYPNGDGQFGYAQWTGAASAAISNNFVSMCVPWSGTPVRFSDADIKIADMNGDGLPDIVRVDQGNIRYWPGRGNGFWGTGDPTDCAGGSFGEGRDIAMTNPPEFSDPSGSNLRLDDVNGDGLDDLVQVGFNAIEVWLNVDGTSWTHEHVIANTPAEPSYTNRVRLVDFNGSGTRDLLWGDGGAYKYIDLAGGKQPWMLTHVANGLGKTTDLTYGTSTQLMLAAEAAGQPWTSKAPTPIQVVTRVTESDHLDVVGLPAGNYVTQYSYRDAVYDGRQREFRGFRTASERKVGDANSPSVTSSSTFLLGECANDENLSPDPCTAAGRWEDNPREALKGLPLTSEKFDDNGVYLSTKHSTYRLRKLYEGLDGREVRVAFQSSADSFLYDTGAFASSSNTNAQLTDVELETALGTVLTDTTSGIPLRASAGRAHLQGSNTVDPFGNATDAIDAGCIDGCAHTDQAVTQHMVPGRPTANGADVDRTGWAWRIVESYVVGAGSSDERRHQFVAYDSAGSPTETTADLHGTLPLDRFHETPGAAVAPPPPSASEDRIILISLLDYDSFGVLEAASASNGRCRAVTPDAAYNQLLVQELEYAGDGDNGGRGCGGTPLSTIAQYDRGLAAVTQVIDLHGETTTVQYDGFGRISTMAKPDPDAIGSASQVPSLQMQYILPADPTQTPYSVVVTGVQDGPDVSSATYRQLISTVDGLGRTILTAEQADTSAGDAASWIVDKLTTYDAKGGAALQYAPWFTSVAPPSGSMLPQSAYSHARYDAFGRVLQTFGLDGAQTLQNVYHALSSEHWDAADLEAGGPHQGTFASELHDGHGRTVSVSERVHNGTAIETHDTVTQYLATGEPTTISRVRAGSSPVTRWLQYDSLGRMVANVEPDSTNGFVPTPGPLPTSVHAWRYAWDDNSDLVGTSDARGCGANYFYDSGGRILAEDFSPCTASQQAYSTPDLSTGDGTEVFYQYDSYANVEQPPTGTPGFPPAALALGRLVAVSDRGAKTVTSYDGRGRPIAVARLIASPLGPSDTLTERYASSWSVRTIDYDGADRPVNASTGADVPALLPGADQASRVTTHYSGRGTVSGVSSTYGALLTSISRDADGLVNQIVYGDSARTTTSLSYDQRRRLSSVQTYRGPPASWSQSPPAYSPAPTPSGPPSTFQLLLEDVDYHYDGVDNPTEIDDWRVPSEWPAGAQPVSRKIQYDDLYRATRVDYVYPGGADAWTSPFSAEDSGKVADPRESLPVPHVNFANRVLRQSFQYDWLGNTTATDDDAHGFYDRSLGTIANGTANNGPYQLENATSGDPTSGGTLTSAYDAAGNLASLALTRTGSCLPSSGTCSQRFVYEWDEVGHLARARRWDLTSGGNASDPVPATTASVDLAYTYDATDSRILKRATDINGNVVFTAYVFSTLELRHAPQEGNDYLRDATTEVAYLETPGLRLARLHVGRAPLPDDTSSPHVLLELADHLGSTALVIDRDTSELVERSTYLAQGQADSDYRTPRWNDFREDYRFTGKEEDVEVGLQYFGKRYYAPSLTRWVSPDPLSIHGLGADANVYAYIHGRLLAGRDPTGLGEACACSRAEDFQSVEPTSSSFDNTDGGTTIHLGDSAEADMAVLGTGASSGDIRPTIDGAVAKAGQANAFDNQPIAIPNAGAANGVMSALNDATVAIREQAAIFEARMAGQLHYSEDERGGISSPEEDQIRAQYAPLYSPPVEGFGGQYAYSLTLKFSVVASLYSGGAESPGALYAEAKGAVGTAVAPDAYDILSDLTATHYEALVSDPAKAAEQLSLKEQLAGPALNAANFGKALERSVGEAVAKDHADILEYVGGPNQPDFKGVGPAAGRTFDITTFKQQAAHYARPYGDKLELILYQSPKGWP